MNDFTAAELPRILLVEDQEDLRENLVQVLVLENFPVASAASGRAALAMIASWQPDLILSDISMPDGDGIWLLREVKNNPASAHIPFLLLTAWADRNNMQLAAELGAAGYITKPFLIDGILQAIQCHWNVRRVPS